MIFTVIASSAGSQAAARRMSATVQSLGYGCAALGPSVLGAVHASSGGWTAPLLVVLGAVLTMGTRDRRWACGACAGSRGVLADDLRGLQPGGLELVLLGGERPQLGVQRDDGLVVGRLVGHPLVQRRLLVGDPGQPALDAGDLLAGRAQVGGGDGGCGRGRVGRRAGVQRGRPPVAVAVRRRSRYCSTPPGSWRSRPSPSRAICVSHTRSSR